MGTVCGNAIYLVKKFIIERHGEEGLTKVLENMSKETADILSGSIMSEKNYDVNVDIEVCTAIDKVFGRPELQELAKYQVKKQITGFFGLILKFVSPDTFCKRSPEMWRKSYSDGNLNVKMTENFATTVVTLSEFQFKNESHMYSITYYFQALGETYTGKKTTFAVKKIDSTTTEITITTI